ncbi:hypothetical protein ATANTOWER_002654 [Ataeniobius toweri]|uniref:Uncharacterized protein n=1 Tax=Ataeniobius toweri TaxID=208326 RepID=A0ABU7A407_9TELE|nr:hypothetical protein [Ataeniobius toweri]
MFDFSLTIWQLLADLHPPSSLLARRTIRLDSRFGVHSPSPDRAACLLTTIWIYPTSLSSPRSCRNIILSFHLLRKCLKILLSSVTEVDLLHPGSPCTFLPVFCMQLLL